MGGSRRGEDTTRPSPGAATNEYAAQDTNRLGRRAVGGVRIAGWAFRELYDRCLDGEVEESERITAYFRELLERWCDNTDDRDKTWPSPIGPLIDCASRPLIYFGRGWSRAEEASAYAAGVADSMGLICFDDVPQEWLSP